MSKKKRVRRDLDKFFRLGRYWDLLRLLEQEGLVSVHAGEHQEAWKALTRQALQQQRAFDQFCREVGTLKSLPNEPNLRFLMGLRGFIQGRSTAEEVLELKGLNPEAVRLRSSFATFAASAMHQEKLRALLAKFMREPGKITRRFFEDVADFISVSTLEEPVRHMGESISLARSFNQKAAVARGWDGLDIRRLEMLDSRLSRLFRFLPQTLWEILLHPFVHNLAVMFRRLAPEASSNRAARLARAIPFLLPRLAGEKYPEIERRLLSNREAWIDGSGNDLNTLREKVEGLRIEEKLSLLGGLRLSMHDRPFKERGSFEDLDCFDDDDNDFPETKRSDAVDLSQAILLLHGSILRDISRQLPELPPRDRKELVRVMEPILFHDLDYILEVMESADEFLSLLNAAIGAGCAGTRMGLLAVLAGAHYRHGDLRKRAEKYLDELAAPTQQDMEWLAKEWSELYYPSARSLKPLLARYQSEKALLAIFSAQLCSMVEFALLESMLEPELSRLPFALKNLLGPPKPREPGILRQELAALTEYEVLDPVRHFLRCYAGDRLTIEGHLCWLNAVYSLRPEEVWGFALAELRRYREMEAESQDFLPLPFPLKASKTLYTDKVEAVLLFLKDHHEELATFPTDTLGPLLVELLDHAMIPLGHHSLLIRLEKLLAERVEAGEETARPLRERIKHTLQTLARREKKTRKPRKSNR